MYLRDEAKFLLNSRTTVGQTKYTKMQKVCKKLAVFKQGWNVLALYFSLQ